MKAGWKLEKLGDVCDIIMGQSPDGKSYNSVGQGIPLINGPVEFSNGSFGETVRSKFTTQPTKLCKEGDLILCVRGSTTGRMNIAGFDACIGRGVAAIRSKQFQPWINYFVSSKRDEIHGKGTGATFPNVSGTMLANFELLMPPLPEQQRIVAILDEAFEAIAAARANAEHNRQNARALFESYLQSVFSQHGEGWKKVPLGGLCDFLNGYAFKSDDATSNSNTQLVRMGNLYGNKLDLDRNPVFYPDNYAEDYKRFILAPGDLVMSLTGTTGKEDYGFAVQIPEAARVLLLNQRIAKFDSIKEDLVCREYLLHYLRSRVFLDLLYPTAKGTRQANLSTVTMKTLPVWLCSIPEQKTIIASLNAVQIDTQRLESLYQRKIAALDELKQSLLQQAFSGQL
ncbi:restriction endonuclease subunit S [Aeromonas veronii]|nr:restriction endonuclease subunit S [Aeromonas veronii]